MNLDFEVSVIIVNYNTISLTKQCIDSIFRYTTGISFEVILVDNASSDGSAELFSKDERIVFIPSSENIGFGRANNLAFLKSSGKYIFLLNSDTYLKNNAIGLFFDYAEHASSDNACLGSLLLDSKDCIVHSYGNFFSKKEMLFSYLKSIFGKARKKGNILLFDDSGKCKVDYITGADLFIRRSVIEECGLFDSAFFMYYEEHEMQYRYAQKGYMSYLIAGPLIVHLEGESGKNKFVSKLRRAIQPQKSQFIFYKKWSTPLSYYSFRLFFFIVRIPVLLIGKYSKQDCLDYFKVLLYKVNI